MPSLLEAEKLKVSGKLRFADGVKIVGSVSFTNDSDDTKWVAGGTYTDEDVVL